MPVFNTMSRFFLKHSSLVGTKYCRISWAGLAAIQIGKNIKADGSASHERARLWQRVTHLLKKRRCWPYGPTSTRCQSRWSFFRSKVHFHRINHYWHSSHQGAYPATLCPHSGKRLDIDSYRVVSRDRVGQSQETIMWLVLCLNCWTPRQIQSATCPHNRSIILKFRI